MYYYNEYSSGWLMGWMVGRKFRKFLPTDEYYEYLPQYVRDLLNDEIKLDKYLKMKWGGYYDGIYE